MSPHDTATKSQKDIKESLKDLKKIETRVQPLEERFTGVLGADRSNAMLTLVLKCKDLEGLAVRVIPCGDPEYNSITAGGTTAGGTTAGGTTAGGTTAGGTTAGGTTAGGTTAG